MSTSCPSGRMEQGGGLVEGEGVDGDDGGVGGSCFHWAFQWAMWERGLSHWASSWLKAYSARWTQSASPSFIRRSAIIYELHSPPVTWRWPEMTWYAAASQGSCLLIISHIYNYRSTPSWQCASLRNDCASFNLRSCQCRRCSRQNIRCRVL